MWQSNDNFIFEEINQQSINDLISQSNHPSIHPSNNWSINNRNIYCRSSCACRWPWGADCFVWSRSFCAPLTCSLPSRTSTRARTGSRSRCVNVRPPTGGTVSASSFFPRVRLAEFFFNQSTESTHLHKQLWSCDSFYNYFFFVWLKLRWIDRILFWYV